MKQLSLIALVALTLPTMLTPAASAPGALVITLDDARTAWKKNIPAGIDEALIILEAFSTKYPDNKEVQAAVRDLDLSTRLLGPGGIRLSLAQAARVQKLLPVSAPPPAAAGAEFDVKAGEYPKVPADSWFAKISKEQQVNFDLTAMLQKFVVDETPWLEAPVETARKMSAQIREALNADLSKEPFPMPVVQIIGKYAAGCPDIDGLLLKIGQSDMAPLMESRLKSAEALVTSMLGANPVRFGHYRDFQKRGITYPLSAVERRRWETAGYAFRPMMMKRDRMVCDACGLVGTPPAPVTEVSGFLYINGDYSAGLSYMDPADYHDYSKPHPEKVARLKAQAILNPSAPTCENMPDPDSPAFLRYVLRRLNLRAQQISKLPEDALKLVSPDLRNAARLWANFSATCAMLMGWALTARYCDNPTNWDSTPKTYRELQQFIKAH